MKKTLYKFLLCLFIFCNLHSLEINQHQKSMSPYQIYYLVKEFIKIQCNMLFGYISYEKLQSSKIWCSKCHAVMNGSQVWAYLAVFTQESFVQELIENAMHSSQDKLSDCMIHACNQISLPCYACDAQYHGWSVYENVSE